MWGGWDGKWALVTWPRRPMGYAVGPERTKIKLDAASTWGQFLGRESNERTPGAVAPSIHPWILSRARSRNAP